MLIGRIQRISISHQAFAPECELARLVFNVALIGREHLNLLLNLRHAASLLIGFGLRLTQSFFQLWQGLGLIFNLRSQRNGLVFSLQCLFRQRLKLGLRLNLPV